MLPLVALLAVVLDAPPALTAVSIAVGAAAALVQALGLVRWPYAVPELARRYVAAEGPEAEATRRSIEVIFATLHRLLGVGIGEHLGYLLTGLWTVLIAISVLSTAVLPSWLGFIGLPIGIALLVGALEFVGPTSATAGRSRARSCRSRTSHGRCGWSPWGSSCSCDRSRPIVGRTAQRGGAPARRSHGRSVPARSVATAALAVPWVGLDVDRGDDRLELRAIRRRDRGRDPASEREALAMDVDEVDHVQLVGPLDIPAVAVRRRPQPEPFAVWPTDIDVRGHGHVDPLGGIPVDRCRRRLPSLRPWLVRKRIGQLVDARPGLGSTRVWSVHGST